MTTAADDAAVLARAAELDRIQLAAVKAWASSGCEGPAPQVIEMAQRVVTAAAQEQPDSKSLDLLIGREADATEATERFAANVDRR